MSKEKKGNKSEKKLPLKTLKEKRADKAEKKATKESNNSPSKK